MVILVNLLHQFLSYLTVNPTFGNHNTLVKADISVENLRSDAISICNCGGLFAIILAAQEVWYT